MRGVRLTTGTQVKIKYLYHDFQLSSRIVAQELGISDTVVRNYMTKWGLIRNQKDAISAALQSGRWVPPMTNRRGKLSPNWRGGKTMHGDGYVQIYLAPNDPLYCMRHNNQYVFEHRYVMAKHLGRPLTRKEFVHHLNGIKHDNRLSNLALTSPSNHKPNTLTLMFQKRIRELEAIIAQQKLDVKTA